MSKTFVFVFILLSAENMKVPSGYGACAAALIDLSSEALYVDGQQGTLELQNVPRSMTYMLSRKCRI